MQFEPILVTPSRTERQCRRWADFHENAHEVFEISERTEIVEVVHTIPQEERNPKRSPEQIVALTCHKWHEQTIRDS